MKKRKPEYTLEIKPSADRIFHKMVKRNRKRLIMINKKIGEILKNPEHEYKFLKKPLQKFNRVHIDTNFVLIFKIDHSERSVIIYFFDHHDKVYKWRPKTDE